MNATATNDTKPFAVSVPGDLVSTTTDALRQQLAALLEPAGAPPPWRTLQLDLTHASMVDSVGLNLIVTILRAVQNHGGKMQIKLTSPNVLRTFQFTRLNQHIELIQQN
jgi:anti-anti-sigma factor